MLKRPPPSPDAARRPKPPPTRGIGARRPATMALSFVAA